MRFSPQLVLLTRGVDGQLYSSLCHVFPSDVKEGIVVMV